MSTQPCIWPDLYRPFREEVPCRAIAKHAMVELTQALSTRCRRTGVLVACLCPSQAAWTLQTTTEAFLRLVTTGKNGDIMCVWRYGPPFIYKGHGVLMACPFACVGIWLCQLYGVEVVRRHHLFLTVLVLLAILLALPSAVIMAILPAAPLSLLITVVVATSSAFNSGSW